jgi:hypothetical protein
MHLQHRPASKRHTRSNQTCLTDCSQQFLALKREADKKLGDSSNATTKATSAPTTPASKAKGKRGTGKAANVDDVDEQAPSKRRKTPVKRSKSKEEAIGELYQQDDEDGVEDGDSKVKAETAEE